MHPLFLASGNPGKLADFAPLLRLQLLPGFATLDTVEETGATFEANACLKAVYYSAYTDAAVLADDSGLAVDALDGAPGIFSARFAGRHGDDAANNRLLLELLAAMPPERRCARFICVLALARQGTVLSTFRGEARGIVLDAPRGTGGFGYDSLFYSPAAGKTFAEMAPAEKSLYSHRGAAARTLESWFAAQTRAASMPG